MASEWANKAATLLRQAGRKRSVAFRHELAADSFDRARAEGAELGLRWALHVAREHVRVGPVRRRLETVTSIPNPDEPCEWCDEPWNTPRVRDLQPGVVRCGWLGAYETIRPSLATAPERAELGGGDDDD